MGLERTNAGPVASAFSWKFVFHSKFDVLFFYRLFKIRIFVSPHPAFSRREKEGRYQGAEF